MYNKISISQRLFLLLERTSRYLFNKLGFGNRQILKFLTKSKIFLRRNIKATTLNQLVINLAEHCNFSCYSCSVFSCLAEPYFPDLETAEKDLKHLSKLFNRNIPSIHFSGGEPLLNPKFPDFARITRLYFPDSIIRIITNGLLLLSQKNLFWESVKEYNLTISPTKYPGINWDKIEEKANKNGVKFIYYDYSEKSKKTSRKFSLDLSGSQNINKSFKECMNNNCTMLKNGRIAPCNLVFSINHFNTYFKKNIPISLKDSIDIYKVESMKEIVDFAHKPIPLCAYCKSMGKEIIGDWRKSERKIEEWI